MSFVAVDLGASNTRFACSAPKFDTISNRMCFVETVMPDGSQQMVDTPVAEEVTSTEIKDNLELIIYKNGPSKFFPMHVLIGSMTESSNLDVVIPESTSHKYSQRSNYASAIASVVLSVIEGGIDPNVNLYIAVPPSEIRESKKVFGEELLGQFSVVLPRMGGATININIKNLVVKRESQLAINSFFCDSTGKPITEHVKYTNETILSLDIGASTTDFAIANAGKVSPKTCRGVRYGCNFVIGEIRSRLTDMDAYTPSVDEAENIMITGRRQKGATWIDMSDVVRESKRKAARRIVNSMFEYFQNIEIYVNQIYAVVVSGGGSMASRYPDMNSNNWVETTEPMSKFITEALREKNEGIEVLDHSSNPRFANIVGLYLVAIRDEAVAAKAAEAAGNAGNA